MTATVLKYGIGYQLVVVESGDGRLYLGICCAQCGRTSYHAKDITERYCGHCHRFHEDTGSLLGA